MLKKILGGVLLAFAALLLIFGPGGLGLTFLISLGLPGYIILVGMLILMGIMMLIGKREDQSQGAGDAPAQIAGDLTTAALLTKTSSTSGSGSGDKGWLGTVSAGNIILLSSGLALMGMGVNLVSNPPAYQQINVPAVQLPGLLSALSHDSGQTVNNPVGDVFVYKNPGGGDDHAAIVTANPSGSGDIVQAVTLDPNGNVVGPYAPNVGYKPLLVPSASDPTGLARNPDAVLAQNTQIAALNLANSNKVSIKDRVAALNLATGSSKYVTPTGN